MKFLPLILKNALRKKMRTLLTIGSIVLPLLVICLMGTFLKALEAPDPRTAHGSFRLVVRHRVSLTSSLPSAYEEKVRQVPESRPSPTSTFSAAAIATRRRETSSCASSSIRRPS